MTSYTVNVIRIDTIIWNVTSKVVGVQLEFAGSASGKYFYVLVNFFSDDRGLQTPFVQVVQNIVIASFNFPYQFLDTFLNSIGSGKMTVHVDDVNPVLCFLEIV